jgi:carbamoyl-phosphate synthase large subunit
VLRRNGVRATIVRKHSDGPGPDGEPTSVQRILAGQVDLIVTTVDGGPPARSRAQSHGQLCGHGPRRDGYEIRTAAVRRGIPCVTTAAGLAAAVQGIEAIIGDEVGVRSLQEHSARLDQLGMGRPGAGRPGAGRPGTGP